MQRYTFDSGGAGNYANNENFTLTICPENTGDAVQLDFIFLTRKLQCRLPYHL